MPLDTRYDREFQIFARVLKAHPDVLRGREKIMVSGYKPFSAIEPPHDPGAAVKTAFFPEDVAKDKNNPVFGHDGVPVVN